MPYYNLHFFNDLFYRLYKWVHVMEDHFYNDRPVRPFIIMHKAVPQARNHVPRLVWVNIFHAIRTPSFITFS